MEAIKAIAKKNKSSNYKIELPDISNDAEINAMIIIEDKPKKQVINLSEFPRKMEWEGDPSAYPKND